MAKQLETKFKRIETKYILTKDERDAILSDLKEYMVEDDYPTSSIMTIYFDNENFDMIKDAIAKKNMREKVRMRTYNPNPQLDSQVFLEIKKKDSNGVGHKFRLVSEPDAINQLITDGAVDSRITDHALIEEIQELRQRYSNLKPRMLICYDRLSFKEKHTIKGHSASNIRLTIDQNLTYRDSNVSLFDGKAGYPLLDNNHVIMEIKAPGQQPHWLKEILDKHAITAEKFSKYSNAYRKSQGILSV